MNGLRRLFIGKETLGAFAVLSLAMATIPHFILTYYPIALATFVRNVYLASIGQGPVFYFIALLGVYLEAIVVALLFRVARRIYTEMVPQEKSA